MSVELLKNVLDKDNSITTRLIELETDLRQLQDMEFENAQEIRSRGYNGIRLREDMKRVQKAIKAERKAQRKARWKERCK